MIKSVSLILLKPTEKLTIKLSVNLLDGFSKESFYSIYEQERYDYLTINISANVIFQFKQESGMPWDRSFIVHINDGNIYQVNKFFQDFYRIMTKPDLFSYGKTLSCNATEKDVMNIILKGGEFLELEPSVIYDTNGTSLPGVLLRLNVKANTVELSIDEYEAVMYKLSKIDITADGLKLLITRMLMDDRIENSKKLSNPSYTPPEPPTGNIFQQKIESEKETVTDSRPISSGITSLDDLY